MTKKIYIKQLDKNDDTTLKKKRRYGASTLTTTSTTFPPSNNLRRVVACPSAYLLQNECRVSENSKFTATTIHEKFYLPPSIATSTLLQECPDFTHILLNIQEKRFIKKTSFFQKEKKKKKKDSV